MGEGASLGVLDKETMLKMQLNVHNWKKILRGVFNIFLFTALTNNNFQNLLLNLMHWCLGLD